jgi:hypothetical protein
MKIRKKGYKPMLGLTLLFTLAAISTVFPNPVSDHFNMMGYHSVCSGAPMSTLVLVLCAGGTCFLRKRYFTEKG